MKTLKLLLTGTIFLYVLLLFSCSTMSEKVKAVIQTSPESDYLEILTIVSPEIEKNQIGEKSKRMIMVLLPPSYFSDQSRRYPVVYNLQGYGGESDIYSWNRERFFSAMKDGESKEFIIVDISGTNKHGGAFYTNSPVTGNWENHVVREIIETVDENYRTIPERVSRGLSGFSMGGWGALILGMKHSNLFSAVFSASPGILAPGELTDAMSTWNSVFEKAYGLVFAPHLEGEKPTPGIPVFDGSDADRNIIKGWESGYGAVEEKLANYMDRGVFIDNLYIQYGSRDNYRWIISGCRYLIEKLNEYGINHTYWEFNGGHRYRVENYLTFFSSSLE